MGLPWSKQKDETLWGEWGTTWDEVRKALKEDEELVRVFQFIGEEWKRRRAYAIRASRTYVPAQATAVGAPALAAVMSGVGLGQWAVIPSAIATGAASSLAAFGFHLSYQRNRRMAHELSVEAFRGFEGCEPYVDKDRIPKLIDKLKEINVTPPPPPDSAAV
jgi:hypothetical protein